MATEMAQAKIEYTQCRRPLTYKVVQLDSQFGIYVGDLEKYLKQSSDVWNQAAGRDVLQKLDAYSNKAPDISIRFIYRQEQKLADLNKKVGVGVADLKKLSEEQALLQEKLKPQIERLKRFKVASDQLQEKIRIVQEQQKEMQERGQELARANESLNQEYLKKYIARAEYEQRRQDLQPQFDSYNLKAKELSQVIQKLRADQMVMQKERDLLLRQKNETEDTIARINKISDEYQDLHKSTNEDIRNLNKDAGKVFHKGETLIGIRDGKYQPMKIEILSFRDIPNLKSTLIHEMGHALGLQHSEDQSSVMYFRDLGKETSVTKEDGLNLRKLCQN